MKKWKNEYKEIQVPEEMKDRIEEAVASAREQKKKVHTVKRWKHMSAAAAVLALVLVLPNTSQTAAAAMQQIPLLGEFFKVVTVREYHVDEERNYAKVNVPEILTDETALTGSEEAMTPNEEAAAIQAKDTTAAINFDIQKVTDELIEEFKTTLEEAGDEGYHDLYIDSEVLTDDERWFSLELVLYQGAGSGYERHCHYTIDKLTGKRSVLADFFEENYVEMISEEIKKQMREQMTADEGVIYWLDDELMGDENFDQIAEDQDFYVNKDGQVVVCFNEYDVAPGYMGCVEFVLPDLENFKKI